MWVIVIACVGGRPAVRAAGRPGGAFFSCPRHISGTISGRKFKFCTHVAYMGHSDEIGGIEQYKLLKIKIGKSGEKYVFIVCVYLKLMKIMLGAIFCGYFLKNGTLKTTERVKMSTPLPTVIILIHVKNNT